MDLSDALREKGFPLVYNLERTLKTADLDTVVYGVPVWKHIHHTLYWFDGIILGLRGLSVRSFTKRIWIRWISSKGGRYPEKSLMYIARK